MFIITHYHAVNPVQLILLVFLVLMIVLIALSEFRDVRWLENNQITGKTPEISVIAEILKEHPYFKNLSAEGKKRFAERTRQLILIKYFKGMNGLQVTTEMKVQVAASLVQLTFGLEKYQLRHFTEIRLFPKPFYSKIINRYLKGGASPGGILMLSWSDFVDGYADASDRYNLGLHESAHALRMDVIHGNAFEKELGVRMVRWEQEMRHEFEMMQENRTGFLRDYAATNEEEFFAVCVEHFFEVPEAFRQRLPDLYYALCVLLRQEPTEKDRDYRPGMLVQSMIDAEPKAKTSRYDNWHWSLTVLLAGIFALPFAYIPLIGRIDGEPQQILLYFVVSVLAALFFFRKLVSRQRQVLGRVQYVSFCILGMGPLIFTIVLTLNMLIPGKPDVYEDHVVSSINERLNTVFLNDGAYNNSPVYRWFSPGTSKNYGPGDVFRIHFRTGIMGLRTYRYSEFVHAGDLNKK